MPSSNRDDNPPGRRLGKHLRRIRVAAGYPTQAVLAKRMGWGEDTISKGESGGHVPSENVFFAWIEACRTSQDKAQTILADIEIAMLTDLWESAREAQSNAVVPDSTKPWYKVEASAEFLFLWDTTLVPGMLQTKGYAHPLFEALRLDQDKIQDLVSVLSQRQARLDDTTPVQLVAVLHESVLYNQVGPELTMVKQLNHLLERSQRPNVTVQVTRGASAYTGLAGPFQIARVAGEPDTVLTPAIRDQTSQEPSLIRDAAILFEKIRRNALPAEDSQAVMRKALLQWESKQQ